MLPDFIIIGGMKCGTSSLHYYLGLHPDISVSPWKELDFFVAEENWPRGLSWYQAQFTGRGKLRGEASPKYTFYPRHAGVPERMAATVPAARLIYLVRDPIQRIISHYIHLVAEGAETRSLDDALAATEDSEYLWRSRYYAQLERYLACFDRKQILIVAQEDLLGDRQRTLDAVFQFLGVAPFCHPGFARIRHPSQPKRVRSPLGHALARRAPLAWLGRLNPAIRWHCERIIFYPFSTPIVRPVLGDSRLAELRRLLREDVTRLEEFAGRRFAWPSLAPTDA